VRRLASLPAVRIQLGGLLRTADQVAEAFDLGVHRVVIATAGVADPATLEEVVTRLGAARLAAAIDVRRGRPVLRGSPDPMPFTASDLARGVLRLGLRTVVSRDLDRDGLLQGFDFSGARELVPLGLEVVVAGGGGSLEDLAASRAAGCAGAIVGRALHEGRFTLREAIACSG
jgi:phosphoribosylformimino-5-aminoimidazole carboxamide ribotide isomerase